jgi:hypothetical protein
MAQTSQEQSSGDFEKRVRPVIDVLARLAKDRVYGPLDLLSRVEDSDEFFMRMAREALYTALRYVSTEKETYPGLEDSVNLVLRMIERRPLFAKELALKSLAVALGGGS